MEELILSRIEESARLARELTEGSLSQIVQVTERAIEAIANGHKIMLFGNGGSAAEAQHIAAEFVNRFLKARSPMPAVALTTDTSVLTSISNDIGFEKVFANQIKGLGKEGDLAWAMSTSGNSANLVEALKTARSMAIRTVGFTGKEGGAMSDLVDVLIKVPSESPPRIQEAHLLLGHIVCELVEQEISRGPQ
jgi:D-sedoheptulose 7-phosphate isomerase